MQYRAYEADSIPLDPKSPFFWDHVSRYWWATQYAKNQSVLDCACGRGYGSYILSSVASSVTGIDLNPNSLQAARRFFPKEHLTFKEWDVFKLSEMNLKFDLITAFEVIEHLPPQSTHSFLSSLAKALKPTGILLLSTPNHDVVLKSGSWVPEFHINNFKAAELRQTLKNHFQDVEMLGQFKERSGLNSIIFNFDYFNLRHLLRHLIPKKNKPLNTTHTGEDSIESVMSYFKTRPQEVDHYLFSPHHWRQSGLSVSICRSPIAFQ